MFEIEFSDLFKKQYQKLIRKNKKLETRIDLALLKLAEDPVLVSHKVGEFWSCRVTGDLRSSGNTKTMN